MVGEYAVDPTSVVACDSPVKFLDEFGAGTGRLIAPLPRENRWMSAAARALEEGTTRQLKTRARMEDRLAELRLSRPAREALFSPRTRPYDGTLPWIENAVAQHGAVPFQAIIAKDARAHFSPDDADSLEPRFQTARGLRVPRTAQGIVGAVVPLLALSSRVVLVDPHFDPEVPRFRDVPAGIFGRLATGTEVDIVTGSRLPASTWPNKITRHLRRLVPAGISVRVILLEEQPGSPKLHARYVLTNAGGVAVETGLDVGAPGQETDLHLLSAAQYEQAWVEYAVRIGFTITSTFLVAKA
ncbi:hypothetical protein ACI3L1_07635 [Deinococcus sp. SM5_A1]|uniref:hypothetical protein n=1 Tax=Deinococcus sp. SM5_A1 TaxID=3379094 RepID=UPI00385E9673